MTSDYRATRYCPVIEELDIKKQKIVDMIKTEHPRAKDMHAYIRVNESPYKIEFMKAYNFKCAYCGASIDIIPKEMFEIDHFIYEKSFETKADAGFIENLVLSCHSCNHRKRALPLPEESREILHPDSDKIKYTFKRDDNFYITVSEEHSNNEAIITFYKTIGLEGEIHRLDYLLMNMIGLQRTLENNQSVYAELGKAIDILRLKRNLM
ncbi:HNH endonuclease [Paenibacillus barengoltzii]|uniref:HNH endonuclease n=1 Tax=Paenibacillus barengoltzii TaxID=343517 RepID=UPI002FD9CB41